MKSHHKLSCQIKVSGNTGPYKDQAKELSYSATRHVELSSQSNPQYYTALGMKPELERNLAILIDWQRHILQMMKVTGIF